MKKSIIVLLFLITWFFSEAQQDSINKVYIVKTLPIQDAFYQNPNLIIEKAINQKNTLSLLVALRYSDWIFESTSFGRMKLPLKQNSKGYTLGGFFKNFYSKRGILKGAYVGGTMRYTDLVMLEVDYTNNSDPGYFRTVDLSRKTFELGGIWGYQAIMSRLVLDFYVGAGLQYRSSKEELVSGSTKYLRPSFSEFLPRIYLGFSVGVKLF